MKRIITVLFATGLLAALATGCKEEYKTYSDAEYVLFADTLATYHPSARGRSQFRAAAYRPVIDRFLAG